MKTEKKSDPATSAGINTRYILTLSCHDVRGIVAAVTNFLAENLGFIIESAQFGDASTATFFMRVEFSVTSDEWRVTSNKDDSSSPPTTHHSPLDQLKKLFEEQVAQRFDMQWQLIPKHRKSRVLVMVSKEGHCLNDLLYRHQTGQLAIDIPAIASNHRAWERTAEWHNIPFYYLPIEKSDELRVTSDEKKSSFLAAHHSPLATKASQEAKILDITKRHNIDLVVLARYMQILSAELCKELAGRAINIHHSFLPSFKGARPYQQAFDRGVKLIGATAHYVTTDLDEGPIIEQEVARVDHTQTPEALAAIGRDIECQVLARAVKYHAEHRVLLNGGKTVVFR